MFTQGHEDKSHSGVFKVQIKLLGFSRLNSSGFEASKYIARKKEKGAFVASSHTSSQESLRGKRWGQRLGLDGGSQGQVIPDGMG